MLLSQDNPLAVYRDGLTPADALTLLISVRSMASFGRNIGKYNAVISGDINEQLLWCSWVLHTLWHYLL
jgi:hypothetical protein